MVAIEHVAVVEDLVVADRGRGGNLDGVHVLEAALAALAAAISKELGTGVRGASAAVELSAPASFRSGVSEKGTTGVPSSGRRPVVAELAAELVAAPLDLDALTIELVAAMVAEFAATSRACMLGGGGLPASTRACA